MWMRTFEQPECHALDEQNQRLTRDPRRPADGCPRTPVRGLAVTGTPAATDVSTSQQVTAIAPVNEVIVTSTASTAVRYRTGERPDSRSVCANTFWTLKLSRTTKDGTRSTFSLLTLSRIDPGGQLLELFVDIPLEARGAVSSITFTSIDDPDKPWIGECLHP